MDFGVPDRISEFLFGFRNSHSVFGVCAESIKKILPGPLTGEMLVYLMKFIGAKSYQLQWGVPGPGGALPTTWINVPVTTIKNPVSVTGLTPGTTYVFHARAVIQNGYSNWGDPIARIAV